MTRHNGYTAALVLVLAWGMGCHKRAAAPVATAELAAGGEPGAAIFALRFRVASEPGDGRAHADLARLELEANRPGAALRHFAIAHRQGSLPAADRPVLAELYARRMSRRMAAGDGGAVGDADAAMALGRKIAAQERAAAYFLAALEAYRRGNSWGRARAREHLGRAAKLMPGDARLASLAPGDAALADLGEAVLWLWRGDALRVARDLAEGYVARGGRDPDVLRAFVLLRRWWGDSQPTIGPGLDLSLRRRLMAAGVSVCPLARSADELGCAGTLMAVARGDARTARAVRLQARSQRWRIRDPIDAAAWAPLGLRGWLAGEGDWDAGLRQRVDVAAVVASGVAPGRLPEYARPTFLRLAGAAEDATQALDTALGRVVAGAAPDTEPGARLLLLAEAALAGRDPAVIKRLASAAGAAAAIHDDLARDMERITAGYRRFRAGAEPAARDLPARDVQRISGLGAVARAYLVDPALSDRLAGDYVDGAVYMGERAPRVAVLFASLGDPARARAWWEKLVRVHPNVWRWQMELGLAVAFAGDTDRARIHLMDAAVGSGNPGATSARQARELIAGGRLLLALSMGRSALALTAPADRAPIMDELARAMSLLGRHEEAAAMRAQIDAGGSGAPGSSASEGGPRVPDVPGAERRVADVQGSGGRVAGSAAARALAWIPDHLGQYAAYLDALAPGSPERARAVTALLVRMWAAASQRPDWARRCLPVVRRALAPLDAAAMRSLVSEL